MRALMLFAATPRAWVRDVCAREMVWTTAERTRRGQFGGRVIPMCCEQPAIGTPGGCERLSVPEGKVRLRPDQRRTWGPLADGRPGGMRLTRTRVQRKS